MNDFTQNFIMALPTLLAISAVVTWLVEPIKPALDKLNLQDWQYGLAVRVAAGVVGIIVAGLMGNPNVFENVVWYGVAVPPLVGMLLTAIIISCGSNVIHEFGERLNMRPAAPIAAVDSNVAVGGAETETVQASSAPMPRR